MSEKEVGNAQKREDWGKGNSLIKRWSSLFLYVPEGDSKDKGRKVRLRYSLGEERPL